MFSVKFFFAILTFIAIALGKAEIERIISERNNKQPQFNAGLAGMAGGGGAPGCSVDVLVPNDKVRQSDV